MSAIHDAARTVDQAAQAEEAKLTAILDEAEDIQHQIGATEERLRNLRHRLATVTADLTAQRRVNEQAATLAEAVRRLEIQAAPAPPLEEWREDRKVGQAPGEQHIEHLAHAAADRTHAFPVMQVAKQVAGPNGMPICDWADCGEELIGGDQEGWLHAATGRRECKPAPVLQEGTDGDPTKRTALPPHIAAEVADRG